MNQPPLELRMLPIEHLVPASYNPRKLLKPGDPAYVKLRASIEQFGLVEPLIWNETSGRVVGGHARLRILKEIGYAMVPVSVVRLNDAQEKSLNIVLNNHEAQGKYDPAKLAGLLEELHELPEFIFTGFDDADLRAMQFEPLEALPEAEPLPFVEVTIHANPESYAEFAASLDELIREYDLVAHIRRK